MDRNFMRRFMDVLERTAQGFAGAESQVILEEPKEQKGTSYPRGELYTAHITNPMLEKLPEGYADALKRLDLRFEHDAILEYVQKRNPDMYRDMLEKTVWRYTTDIVDDVTQVRHVRVKDTMAELEWEKDGQKSRELHRKELLGRSHLGKEDVEYLHAMDKAEREQFYENNALLQDTVRYMKEFLVEEGDKYFYKPEHPFIEDVEAYVKSQRPVRQDSYDLYLQVMMDEDKTDAPFGLMLCDGISSHYMSQEEALQVKREGKNEFLSKAQGKTANLEKASVCHLAAKVFGEIPKKLNEVKASFKNLLQRAFGEKAAKEVRFGDLWKEAPSESLKPGQ